MMEGKEKEMLLLNLEKEQSYLTLLIVPFLSA